MGILWNPETDTFNIKYTFKSVLATKRGILSLISSIFDPLGLIVPALIELKWIIQQLWKRKIDWDEFLPSDLTKCWQKWLDNLPDIQNITLDRWYGPTDTDTELHVFADASKIAYGVACYIRFKVINRPKCSFFMSKSKGIQNIHKRNLYVDRFKNDVLHYLQNEDRNFGIYVSHRVNEILEHIKLNEWNYVSSESNIAYKTSRCQTLKKLSLEKSWFKGPTFLLNNDFNIETQSEKFSVNSINITKSSVKKNSHSTWNITLVLQN